jgi:chloride channel protein, CIC family
MNLIRVEEMNGMDADSDDGALVQAESGGLVRLALVALVGGGAAGLIGAAFRLALEQGDLLRNAALLRAHAFPVLGLAGAIVVVAAAAAIAAWLVVRFSPHAAGSGIPHVEAVLHGEAAPAPIVLLPVKFAGGLLAIGSGLALGREGPSVQMGATIAFLIGKRFGLGAADCRVLLAAGAGAGLATAFNAPMAGAIFVLEELVQKFERRMALAALAASFTAIALARVFLGDLPDFDVAALAPPPIGTRALFLVAGLALGLLAVAYNKALLGALYVFGGSRLPPVWRAASVGACVGALAWFAPGLVGGGDPLTQKALLGQGDVAALGFVLILRIGLGVVSYAAGTPGGLFAPLLAVGAEAGLIFGAVLRALLPQASVDPRGFALVGMAAFFTGVVRAPLTGIVLVTEMTGNTTMLLPMIGASFAAMLVPTLLGDEPIYESLRVLTLERERALVAAQAKADL